MLTICTNDEVNRSTLIQALISAGQTEERVEEICEVDESDIWASVMARFAREFDGEWETSRLFRDWNGGRFCRGHRIGVVHSSISLKEAMTVDKIIDKMLEEEIAATA